MSDMSGLPTRAEEMFCYAVYSATHAINRAYTPHLRALDLTYPQYIALTFLWAQDDVPVGTVARKLGMTTGTVTPLLKRLETLGHVTRVRSEKDERQVVVRLTPTGRALQDKAPQITACMVADTGLTIAELDQMSDLLKRLTANLTDRDTPVQTPK